MASLLKKPRLFSLPPFSLTIPDLLHSDDENRFVSIG
jgi:hypothetical protein